MDAAANRGASLKVRDWLSRLLSLFVPRRASQPALPSPPVSLASVAPDDTPAIEPAGATLRSPAPRVAGAGVSDVVGRGLAEVPPLPHVVRELLRELSDPASNARSVARIAASDPALAASLIRTVNSAAMGMRHRITSVAEAVSYLGYSMVRSLVIRMRLQLIMPTAAGGAQAYDAEDLWVHSLAVAYAAEALCERLPGIDRGFVSTLGLLHDIGKLAINSYFPASAHQVRTPSPDHPAESFLDRERRVLGADHAEIGAMLAQHWKLPPDLVEAIRWHHAPDAAPTELAESVRTATVLVHVANQLAKYCYVYSQDMEIDIVGDDLLRQAGLPAPLTRLLSNRVRRAISRAIFFVDETASGQSLQTIRRFVRLAVRPPTPASAPNSLPRHEPRIEWAHPAWERKLSTAEPVRIDCLVASESRVQRSIQSAGSAVRFASRCTPDGVSRLIKAVLAHQERLDIDGEHALAARFVLRRLLPNLSEMAAGETVDVVQSFEGGVLIVAVCSPVLGFARRFGQDVPDLDARHALNGELANVLNLRWFTRVLTPSDGAALIFVNQVA